MGDLNAIINDKFGHHVNENGKIINDFLEYSPTAIVVQNPEPTFERKHLDTFYTEALDHIVVSSELQVQGNACVVLNDSILLSDHKPLLLAVYAGSEPLPPLMQRPKPFLNLKKADWPLFQEQVDDLLSAAASTIKKDSSIDYLNDLLTCTLAEASAKAIPTTTWCPTDTSLPLAIRLKIDERCDRSKPWLDLIDRSKGKFFTARPLWNKINQMRGKSSQVIPPIRSGDRIIDDDKEKADIFGRLLSDTFSCSSDDS